MGMMSPAQASVAQLDRVLPSEGRGRGFESRRVHQIQMKKPQVERPGAFLWVEYTAVGERLYHAQANIFLKFNQLAA